MSTRQVPQPSTGNSLQNGLYVSSAVSFLTSGAVVWCMQQEAISFWTDTISPKSHVNSKHEKWMPNWCQLYATYLMVQAAACASLACVVRVQVKGQLQFAALAFMGIIMELIYILSLDGDSRTKWRSLLFLAHIVALMLHGLLLLRRVRVHIYQYSNNCFDWDLIAHLLVRGSIYMVILFNLTLSAMDLCVTWSINRRNRTGANHVAFSALYILHGLWSLMLCLPLAQLILRCGGSWLFVVVHILLGLTWGLGIGLLTYIYASWSVVHTLRGGFVTLQVILALALRLISTSYLTPATSPPSTQRPACLGGNAAVVRRKKKSMTRELATVRRGPSQHIPTSGLMELTSHQMSGTREGAELPVLPQLRRLSIENEYV